MNSRIIGIVLIFLVMGVVAWHYHQRSTRPESGEPMEQAAVPDLDEIDLAGKAEIAPTELNRRPTG